VCVRWVCVLVCANTREHENCLLMMLVGSRCAHPLPAAATLGMSKWSGRLARYSFAFCSNNVHAATNAQHVSAMSESCVRCLPWHGLSHLDFVTI